MVEGIGNAPRQRFGLRHLRHHRRRRRHPRCCQHPRLVDIGGHRPDRDLPVAAARQHHRKLMLERHPRFKNRRHAADRIPCRIGIGGGSQPRLAFAVIAETPRLEHRRHADFGNRRIKPRPIVDRGKRHRPAAQFGDEGFFGQPVLRHLKADGPRAHRHPRRQMADRHRVDVLELEGDDIDRRRKTIERRQIVISGARHLGRDIARRHFGLGRQHMDAIAHCRRRQRQHPPELPATEDADCRTGFDHGRDPRQNRASGGWGRGPQTPDDERRLKALSACAPNHPSLPRRRGPIADISAMGPRLRGSDRPSGKKRTANCNDIRPIDTAPEPAKRGPAPKATAAGGASNRRPVIPGFPPRHRSAPVARHLGASPARHRCSQASRPRAARH